MFELLRGPRRLAATIAASVALVGVGFAVPSVIFGGPGGTSIDRLSTGSVTAAVAMPVALPSAVEPQVEPAAIVEPDAIVETAAVTPAPPSNLLMLVSPQVTTPAMAVPALAAIEALEELDGSAAFLAALKLVDDGDFTGAYAAARELPDSAERRAVQWAAIEYGSGKVDYQSVIRFAADAPDFAKGETFQTRLEQAVLRAGAAAPEVIRVLGGAMPATIDAQMSLAVAYAKDGQKERAAGIARTIWIENTLSRSQESAVLKRLGDLLTKADHWQRALTLMMHDRAQGVERLMPYMTEAQKSLAIARNAVSRNRKDAKKLLDAVDPSMQDEPLYLFSRAQRARQFELWDDAVMYLNKATGDLPGSAEWWYERRTLTRQLLALGKYDLAFQAADGYRSGPDGRLVEAHFHAGWIALQFLGKPDVAVEHFEEMTKYATLPDTVTQAHYWLGRARRAAGDAAGAEAAFTVAAGYGTVYYGQLARSELGTAFELRDMPDATLVRDEFEARDTVKAVRLLAGSGEKSRALMLLKSFAHELEDGGELLLAAQLAQQLGANDLAILIAETAEKKGFPLDLVSFPDTVPTTMVAEIDHAAIFAIVRQESRFMIGAVSSAGARGLMQLMPGTAKEVAKKVGLPYSKGRLTTDPAYNAMLGSTYLAGQLEAFGDSLVLAAAAYNAGPGNARKWVKQFGDPRSESVDPVSWIEMIPFQETRKYVQRVVGNYLVYRARLGHDELSPMQALRHIR